MSKQTTGKAQLGTAMGSMELPLPQACKKKLTVVDGYAQNYPNIISNAQWHHENLECRNHLMSVQRQIEHSAVTKFHPANGTKLLSIMERERYAWIPDLSFKTTSV